MNKKNKIFLYRFFEFTLIIKAIDGVLELTTSIVLFFFGANIINNIIPLLVQEELAADPNDAFSNWLLNITQNMLPSTQAFIVAFLALHGLIKIGLVIALSSRNHRAYQIGEIFLLIFVFYQLYRFSHTHSLILLIITIIDVAILSLARFKDKTAAPNNLMMPKK